jgi:hypothetical protein
MGPALLLERDWAGLACYPGSKTPAWPRGVHDATNDPDRLTGWWIRHPDDNVAVGCERSRLTVVDLDVKAGTDGVAIFSDLCDRHAQPWPDTFSVLTPSGGLHLYFAGTQGSSHNRLGPGIDIKSRGGYVLCPTSTVNGFDYRPTNYGPVIGFPDWLAELCRPPASKAPVPDQPVNPDRARRWALAVLADETANVTGAVEPGRNDTLYLAALKLGSVAGAGLLGFEQIADTLTTAALACGLELGESRRTIESGYWTGYTNPRRPR